MTFRVSRRNFVAGGATLLSLSALGTSALAQETRLRLLWWGSQPRADRTNKVSQLYHYFGDKEQLYLRVLEEAYVGI
ncbi:hypothetical protein AB9E26_35665, partial [Rhizobium leguminosarum]